MIASETGAGNANGGTGTGGAANANGGTATSGPAAVSNTATVSQSSTQNDERLGQRQLAVDLGVQAKKHSW